MIEVSINNKTYKVKEAKTDEERRKGLKGVKKLPENEGMLFYYDPPRDVAMWMKGVDIPLDIIFFDEDQEVISVHQGTPNSDKLMTTKNTAFVLEVNKDSGIKEGDFLDLETDDEPPLMKVLSPDGSTQMELWGGERIFSRKNTKILVKKAKKAAETQSDTDYKALGKYMFKCIKIQDERSPEYVDSPKSKD